MYEILCTLIVRKTKKQKAVDVNDLTNQNV
jgi:hypothetical protein